MLDKIKVVFSCGDINGIGLECLIKVFEDERMFKFFTPIVYASRQIVNFHRNTLKHSSISINEIREIDHAREGKLNVVNFSKENVKLNFGQPDKSIASYVLESLKLSVDAVLNKKADAIITLPINKEVLHSDQFNYSGHTEYLRDRSGVEESLMFLVTEQLKVGLVTNHLSIGQVAGSITEDAIIKKAKIMHHSLKKDFGMVEPKIALLGLNPHAGDNGLIGKEEIEVIDQAIQKLNKNGVRAFGPYSADGFFGMKQYAKFDAVLAMYHDQGLIPFKMLAFEDGVNFTAGLPIVRTSPDHGTAYDIAGKDKADPTSLRNSIFTALQICRNREA